MKENNDLNKIGDVIEKHFKKSLSKVEEIFKDTQAADDKVFRYFKAFVDDKGVASVTPSSKYIIERVLKSMDLRGPRVIVEYGAADGVMTKRVLEKLPKDGSRVVAFELNDQLYGELKKIKDPRLTTIHGDVRTVDQHLKKLGISTGEVDIIFSGIPFAFLSGRGRHELLTKTSDLLKPSGRFIAYQVTTHLIPLLKDYFSDVKTQFEIRNLPPHFVFTAFK
jgi:phospholipid N-methyltransferase